MPQTAASRNCPERLRLRRSGSAIPGSIAAADNRDHGDLLGASVKRRRPFARATATDAIDSPASTGEAFARMDGHGDGVEGGPRRGRRGERR